MPLERYITPSGESRFGLALGMKGRELAQTSPTGSACRGHDGVASKYIPFALRSLRFGAPDGRDCAHKYTMSQAFTYTSSDRLLRPVHTAVLRNGIGELA
jgi:hypothetical protein